MALVVDDHQDGGRDEQDVFQKPVEPVVRFDRRPYPQHCPRAGKPLQQAAFAEWRAGPGHVSA